MNRRLAPPNHRPARIPDHVTKILIENATDAGRDIRPGRAQRSDGWTQDRIRTFLQVLAQGGGVARAARAAGISRKSAYALRNSAKGAAFDRAWHAAASFARRRPEGRLLSNVTGKYVVPNIRNGKVWDEHPYEDTSRLITTLKRLDRMTAASRLEDSAARLAPEHFDALLDCICPRANAQPSEHGRSDEA